MEANNRRRRLIRHKLKSVLAQREQGGIENCGQPPKVVTEENRHVDYDRNGMAETEIKVSTAAKPGMRKIQMTTKSFAAGRPPL